MRAELIEAITEMQEEDAFRIARELLDEGTDPIAILDDCQQAMGAIGERFEVGEYFLPELLLAGEMMGQISALVKPRIKGTAGTAALGKIVLGTVQGDIHDLGKGIVAFMLDVHGFEVHDLGVDVSPQMFIEAILAEEPVAVGLSGLLTLAFESMKQTVDGIQDAGLRDKVKIMIGGATIDLNVLNYSGADAFGPDAMAAVSLARQWAGVG